MPHIRIIIHRKNAVEPSMADYTKAKEYVVDTAALVEHGSSSGKAAIVFGLIDPETGDKIVGQMTENIFNGVVSALKGAKQHWEENPV